MKVLILAGGFGSRLSEYSKDIPKPMVIIANKPILWHIMSHYAYYEHKEFFIALGYKSQIVINYFKRFEHEILDSNEECLKIRILENDWIINFIQTGLHTMTGGRVKRLSKYINDKIFFLTYGDGLSNIDMKKQLDFHKKNKKLVTISAVRPPARFGFLQIEGDEVKSFREKSQLDEGWINGGFFIIHKDFINYIQDDTTFLEKEPLIYASKINELYAYKHKNFWQCMDTQRDKENLEKIIKKINLPWIK